MAKTIVDTDYLFLSSRIKAMESRLLSRDRMERMLDTSSAEDAAKVLSECGYGELSQVTMRSIEAELSHQRDLLFEELAGLAPDPDILDVFRVKYDYHNVKVILKAEAVGADPNPLLVDAGRVKPAVLLEAMRTSEMTGIPSFVQQAAVHAREILSATGDPQLSDFALDRAYFEDMLALAEDSGSSFLMGYVRIQIDAANLRTLVRTLRMQKSMDFLKGVLIRGGEIDVNRLMAAASGGSLAEPFAVSPLHEAAECGAGVVNGGGLTEFERLCDNAVLAYVAGAKYVAFGEAPVIGYLAAKENELTAVRIILTGLMAGLDADTIRERLRDSYV